MIQDPRKQNNRPKDGIGPSSVIHTLNNGSYNNKHNMNNAARGDISASAFHKNAKTALIQVLLVDVHRTLATLNMIHTVGNLCHYVRAQQKQGGGSPGGRLECFFGNDAHVSCVFASTEQNHRIRKLLVLIIDFLESSEV